MKMGSRVKKELRWLFWWSVVPAVVGGGICTALGIDVLHVLGLR